MRETKQWTDSERWALASETGFACAYCEVIFGSVARRPGSEPRIVRMVVEHFTPVSWTGIELDAENLVAACQICNSIKSAHLFDTVANARRYINRRWVQLGYVIEFIPTRSHFEAPELWAREYARYLRTVGIRQDAE
ncbi:HNH endonuclease signature motif containing protein [Streptomyces virginiae]|uniref:HNH endonuclease n=1 Tax=Streptomyces virginiae TaxID=1961 RepID=UPI00344D84B8